jgi:hypothetical protein
VNELLETIDIEAKFNNFQEVKLSQFTDSIRYVPLASVENLVLRSVEMIDHFDNLFFVSDLTNCLLYDENGNLKAKIGNQGRGPGEYQFVSRIGIGLNRKLYIQSLHSLLEYDLKGKFLKSYDLEGKFGAWNLQSWISFDDSLFFGQIPNFSGNEPNKALIYNSNGNKKVLFKNYFTFQPNRIEFNNFANQANIYHFDDEIHFKERVNDTLFSLSDQFKLIPLYHFYLGDYAIPYINFFQSHTQNSEFVYIDNIFETNNYIFIDLVSNSNHLKRDQPIIEDGFNRLSYTNNILAIYDKVRKELHIVDITRTDQKLLRTGLFNDIDGGPKFYPTYSINQSTLLMPIIPIKLKEHVSSIIFKSCSPKYPEKKKKLLELADKLSEFDNPVLMVIYFTKSKK